MFERLTIRANKVVALANQEAKRLNQEQVGSGPLLLGILAEGTGGCAAVLRSFAVDLERARSEVQRLSPPGAKIAMARMLPMTTRMTHVLQLAGDEARALRHADVDAEHLLLGMLRETDGVAVNALRNLGVNLERLRAVVLAKLSGGGDDLAAIHPLSAACPMCAAIQTLGRTGSNWIADLSESHVVLGDNQGCRGWCVLLLKGHVEHLSQVDEDRQARLWRDVSRVAGAIRAVFPESGNGGPPRINYECLGNQVAHVHWHVIPRHADDPEPTKPVWGWPEERLRGTMTEAERGELVKQFRAKLAPGS